MKKLILLPLLLLGLQASAAPTKTVDQYSPAHNLLQNPGFENGLYGWTTTSGTLTQTNVFGSVAFGNASAYFTPSGASSALRSSEYVLSSGLYGGSCLARVMYRGGQTGYAFSILDGSNTVISGASILSQSNYSRKDVAFTCPTSGSVKLQVIATSGSLPSILVDDFYLGENFTQASSTGASYVVSVAKIAVTSSCTWSTTSSTPNTAFATVSACPGPTSEYLVSGQGITFSTTDTDLPKFTYNDLPSGKYLVRFHVAEESGGGAPVIYVTDGTDYFGFTAQAVGLGSYTAHTIEGIFSYSEKGNRTFEVRGSNNGVSATHIVGEQGVPQASGVRIVVVRLGD